MSLAIAGSSIRDSRRLSVTQLWTLTHQQQDDVEDDLTKAQKKLKQLKTKISTQSKKNFVLERDVRYLDSRIALLIQHRSALDAEELANNLEEMELVTGSIPEERKRANYGNLFFILQTEPKYIASLTRLVNMAEIDTLLQTVMFTLYGNQYESREEHLLLSVFQMVLQAQFEEIKDNEMGTLMRANTPVSRMMTTYTRRGPGQSYLKSCIADCINKVIQMNENLEINPLKVYEQMINDNEVETGQTSTLPRSITPEQAAENAQVKLLIEPRLKRLREWSDLFLDTIISSLNTVPYGIRWISKQIKVLTKRKFPEADDHAVASLIGAFYMLRFLNPAVVTPQAYMLVDSPPSANARRSITLIAKILQNLTNKPNYSKESFMLPLNPFVEENKNRINKFFHDLCEVEDFYEQLEIDQYLALTKKDLQLNITLNEMYNTHDLLIRYADQLGINASESDHMKIILNELGPAPKQLPRNENKPIQLPLFSRWETPINDELTKQMQGQRLSPNEILYQETKTLLVQILRSIPPMKNRPLSLQAVVEAAITSRNANVLKKGQKAQENFKKLEQEGVISSADNYAALTAEVAQELMDLEKLREKVNTELESLESVFATIRDHNNYLRSQLESYRAYLQNVRMQSGSANNRSNNKKGPQYMGPFKFTHSQLEKDGVIIESDVPENRRNNIYFNFMSPIPGSFVIALHYKGRDKAILELDLKLDDLLEKQQVNDQTLDLEYVQFNVNKMLHLLNKTFLKH